MLIEIQLLDKAITRAHNCSLLALNSRLHYPEKKHTMKFNLINEISLRRVPPRYISFRMIGNY